MASKRADRTTISRVGIAALASGMTLAVTGIAGATPSEQAPNDHQVQICHWNDGEGGFSNPNPAKWQITEPNGHGSHDGDLGGDIIPPFAAGTHGNKSWDAFPGLNWTPEVQAFIDAGCVDVDGGTTGGSDEGTTGGSDEGTTGGSDEGTTGGSDEGTTGGSDEGTTGGSDEGTTGGSDEGTTGGTDGGTTGGTTGGTDGGTTGETEALPDVIDRPVSQPGPVFGPAPQAPAAPVSEPQVSSTVGQAPVEVLGAVTYRPGQLPRTGVDGLLMAKVGMVLVALGGLAILGSRRLAPAN